MAILTNIGPDTYILLCKYCHASVACYMLFSHHLELTCRAVNDRHVKDEKSGSSHQDFHVNEPFYYDGGYKIKKLLSFFRK